jgi:hypothetical protein
MDGHSNSTPKKQRLSNNTPAATKLAQSPKQEDDADYASKHPTVPKIVESASVELVSRAISPPQDFDHTSRRRDPAGNMETYNDNKKSEDQPLQVDDLYLERDRTQLHDPHLTPGRQGQPYNTKSNDIPAKLLEHLQETRSIHKSERPRDRLTSVFENYLFVAESRPSKLFNFHSCKTGM